MWTLVLRVVGRHIDLGWGHVFFEKFGVTSKQSPQLLLPLTSFGPQGHKIQLKFSHASSPTNVQFTVQFARARNMTKKTCGSPQHREASHPRLALSPIKARMNKRKTLVTKFGTVGKTERDDG